MKLISIGDEAITVRLNDDSYQEIVPKDGFTFRGYNFDEASGMMFWNITKEEKEYLIKNTDGE